MMRYAAVKDYLELLEYWSHLDGNCDEVIDEVKATT